MNVLRRTIYAGVVAAILTAVSISIFPTARFVQHSGMLIGLGTLTVLALAAISFYREDSLTLKDKKMLMNAFLIAILVPSFYTAGAFVHESKTSWSGGEIHYHADYEVLVPGDNGSLERADLVDPENFCGEGKGYMCKLNDRTGTTKYHEHDDNRIHLEGVFMTREEATLRAYFNTFDGELTNEKLVYPTNDGFVRLEENSTHSLKILVEKGAGGARHWCVIGNEVSQEYVCRAWDTGERATSPDKYVISPYKKDGQQEVLLDKIFIVYDTKTPRNALQDLIDDNKYEGLGIKKTGREF